MRDGGTSEERGRYDTGLHCEVCYDRETDVRGEVEMISARIPI